VVSEAGALMVTVGGVVSWDEICTVNVLAADVALFPAAS
jgi:hypothetical protein